MAEIVRPGHTYALDPDDQKVYGFDWTDWLASGASIASSTWAIEVTDAALTISNEATASPVTSLLVKTPTAGVTYTLVNQITTDESPAQKASAHFYVRGSEAG